MEKNNIKWECVDSWMNPLMLIVVTNVNTSISLAHNAHDHMINVIFKHIVYILPLQALQLHGRFVGYSVCKAKV